MEGQKKGGSTARKQERDMRREIKGIKEGDGELEGWKGRKLEGRVGDGKGDREREKESEKEFYGHQQCTHWEEKY